MLSLLVLILEADHGARGWPAVLGRLAAKFSYAAKAQRAAEEASNNHNCAKEAYMAVPTYNPDRSRRWQDLLNVMLAIWLFFSPWVLQFGGHASAEQPAVGMAGAQAAAANAWVLGAIVFLVSVSALSRMELWQEGASLVLGVWIFIAPWVLGFSGLHAASFDHWIVGALIFAISASSLSQFGLTQPEQVHR